MPERKIRFQNKISGNFVFLTKMRYSGTVFSRDRYAIKIKPHESNTFPYQ